MRKSFWVVFACVISFVAVMADDYSWESAMTEFINCANVDDYTGGSKLIDDFDADISTKDRDFLKKLFYVLKQDAKIVSWDISQPPKKETIYRRRTGRMKWGNDEVDPVTNRTTAVAYVVAGKNQKSYTFPIRRYGNNWLIRLEGDWRRRFEHSFDTDYPEYKEMLEKELEKQLLKNGKKLPKFKVYKNN